MTTEERGPISLAAFTFLVGATVAAGSTATILSAAFGDPITSESLLEVVALTVIAGVAMVALNRIRTGHAKFGPILVFYMLMLSTTGLIVALATGQAGDVFMAIPGAAYVGIVGGLAAIV